MDEEVTSESPTTFWEAAYEVVSQTYALLRPGAHAIFVVKSYVRGGKLVDFPGDWARLCAAVGFTLLHEHHALLYEHHGTQTGLFGEDTVHQTERKSFFRRLAERKGSPKIDHETVLCFVKPGAGGADADCCVTSPPYAGAGKVLGAHNGIDYSKITNGGTRRTATREASGLGYGETLGQLGAMPSGATP